MKRIKRRKRRMRKKKRKKMRKRTRKNAAEADKDASKHCPRILNSVNINKNLAALGCSPSGFGA